MPTHTTYIKLYCAIISLLLTYKGNAQNTDINLLRNINVSRNKSYDGLMKAMDKTVYPISAAIPATELIAGYARHDQQMIRQGWQTVAGLGLTTLLAGGVKYTINRTRPYITYPYIQPADYNTGPSFPSGHTSIAFSTATSLSIGFPRWYVIAPSYLWAAATGYSRLHLGMHYPTDVLAGAVIGAGSAWLSYKGNQWLQHRKTRKPAQE